MKVHLVDGTYELFRSFFGAPPTPVARRPRGRRHARRSSSRSGRCCAQDGVTHVAAAFDHVIESFRNDLYAGYKTGEGMPTRACGAVPAGRARRRTRSGIVVWPMVEFEADDALATAPRAARDAGVEQVVICSPDKDLAQCVRGDRVVCFDRRQQKMLDHLGVVTKFGVPPSSIPDWLALVGDTADGYPGVPTLGRQERFGPARPLRPHRGHPRRRACVGRHRARRRRARERACATTAATRSSSSASPRCASTLRCPRPSTTCAGRAPVARSLLGSAGSWATRTFRTG